MVRKRRLQNLTLPTILLFSLTPVISLSAQHPLFMRSRFTRYKKFFITSFSLLWGDEIHKEAFL